MGSPDRVDRLTEGREGEAGPWGMPTLCLGSWRVGERTQGRPGLGALLHLQGWVWRACGMSRGC